MDQEIEKVKKYWNERPCNIRHSNKEIGTTEYFDEVEKRRYKVEPHIINFAEFPKWKEKQVLEIGCGIGTDTISFLRNGAKVTSVDLSEKSLDITKNRVKVYGYDAEIKFANAEELSNYLDIKKKYDLIYSFGVLHHTPNPTLAFQQVKNFMNEDSEFRLMLYHKGAFKVLQILEEYNFDYSKADIFIAKHSEAQTGCPVTYTYSKNEIIQILDSIGFEIIDLKVSHIFPYRIDEYRKYEYVKEEIWNMPDETFNEFQSRYGWHLLIKCKLKK